MIISLIKITFIKFNNNKLFMGPKAEPAHRKDIRFFDKPIHHCELLLNQY